MRYIPPIGQIGEAPYINADLLIGRRGSIVPAEAIEHTQREIIAAIEAAGLAPSNTALNQLALALAAKSGVGHTHTMGNITDLQAALLALALQPATATRLGGMMVGGGLSGTPEGLVSLALDLGAGLVIKDGKLAVDFATMPTDKFEAMLQSLQIPIVLAKNTSWYVDGTSGSDTVVKGDTKKAQTAATAFKTGQAALDYVAANFNMSTYRGTIRFAGGDYHEGQGLILPSYSTVSGDISLLGSTDSLNPTRIFGGIYSTSGRLYNINDIITEANGQNSPNSIGYYALFLTGGTKVYLRRVTFHIPAGQPGSSGFLRINSGALCAIREGCKFSGTASLYVLGADTGGVLEIGNDVTFSDLTTPLSLSLQGLSQFSISSASNGGVNPVILSAGTLNIVKKFNVIGNSVATTSGGGANYLPGTAAGTTSGGGQYT